MSNKTIAIIGLGYVGLPLGVAFAKHYKTIGFDINKNRIKDLNNAHDRTLEVDNEELKSVLIDSLQYEKGLLVSDQTEVY